MDIQSINWRPKLGDRTNFGIGFVGCGGIVQYGHIPAYKKAGFHMVAAYDLKREAAEAVRDLTGGSATVHDSLDALLADPAVEIVDIAVMPWVQHEIVQKVAAAGKHMLCQKPLSLNFDQAVDIVNMAHQAGVKQAVNHQMRWDSGIAAARQMIEQGAIGTPTDAQIQVSSATPWHMWPWLASAPRLEVQYHSIHYIDSMRFLFGMPEWLTSRHAKYAGQGDVKAETKSITIMDYADGLQAMVAVNHYNMHGETHAVFRFYGTEGAIEGTIGLMYNYPSGRPDTLVYRQQGRDPIELPLDEMWIPDAFVGPMAGLMSAIETDGVPPTDSADNLNTLRLVEAAYLSASENRSVALAGFLEG
ncbi:MAG: Gfo/Idh/MocA family oxidoreductase [Anaerolineae bacterium]|nr:Gfo/Idh/MocA family oxidoreductase [Anaerolineae bacterium]NUQ04782.1 Gfo/Idh/MocA family oxidoreductase [Anaerolineae bacterium]